MKSVLVIAAHPDDELLGVGGTVRRLANEGCDIHAVILAEGITSRSDTRAEANKDELIVLQSDARKAAEIVGYKSIDFCGLPDNRMDGMELLDVIKIVTRFIDKYKPDTIFTHHHGDLNIDHRITCEAVITACRPVGDCCVKRILAFETPSSTEWDFNYVEPFNPNVFIDISDTLDSKIDAMLCYSSESAEYPHPRSSESLRNYAGVRGTSSGYKYAEGFMLLRACVD